jgi:hypothetical protein
MKNIINQSKSTTNNQINPPTLKDNKTKQTNINSHASLQPKLPLQTQTMPFKILQ